MSANIQHETVIHEDTTTGYKLTLVGPADGIISMIADVENLLGGKPEPCPET